MQLLGALPTLAVTAVGSFMSAVSLWRIPESFTPAANRKKPIARDLLEGLRFLRHDRVLAGLLGFSAIANPFAQWITLLFLVDGVRRLHLTTGHIGLALAIGAVGTLLGAATGPAVARRLGALRTIVITAAVDPLVFHPHLPEGPHCRNGMRPSAIGSFRLTRNTLRGAGQAVPAAPSARGFQMISHRCPSGSRK